MYCVVSMDMRTACDGEWRAYGSFDGQRRSGGGEVKVICGRTRRRGNEAA